MAKSILKNAVYDLQEGDGNEYFPQAIENAIVSWDGRTPVTFLYMDPNRISWQSSGQDHSYVYALALMPLPSQEVLYEIKWDVQGVPGGNHLGQQRAKAEQNVFILDLDQDGIPITAKGHSKLADSCYFNYRGKNVFYFRDWIRQDRLQGHWSFRLRILFGDQTVAQSVIDIDWNNRTYR